MFGLRWPLMDWLASTTVYRTGRTARRQVTAEQVTDPGTLSDAIRAMGFFSTVSAPIVVEGELWGVVTASSSEESLPARVTIGPHRSAIVSDSRNREWSVHPARSVKRSSPRPPVVLAGDVNGRMVSPPHP